MPSDSVENQRATLVSVANLAINPTKLC